MFERNIFQRVLDAERFVDEPDVLERVKSNPDIGLALSLRRYRNWWGSGVNGELLLHIARVDAIPLAWVPRASLISALAQAQAASARKALLVANESLVLEDCRSVLADCIHPDISDQRELIYKTLAAYAAGHREAAMALAVSVGEQLALWASEPRVTAYRSETAREAWEELKRQARKYGQAKLLLDQGERYMYPGLKEKVLVAPVSHFFTPWRPESGDPIPDRLSRHVVVHQPTARHFSHFNSLTALMLVVSILRQQHEWAIEVSYDDDPV